MNLEHIKLSKLVQEIKTCILPLTYTVKLMKAKNKTVVAWGCGEWKVGVTHE